MKINQIQNPKLIISLSALLSVGMLANCEEKKAATPAPAKSDTGTGTATAGDEDDGNDTAEAEAEGTGGDDTDFDLCTDGITASTKLTTWKSLVKVLCDDGKIKELRKSANVFKGGTPIISNESEIESLETNMKLYSSAQYTAAVGDYWSLTKLQFVDPAKYKENFEADEDVTVKDVNASATSSTYNYINDGGEGGVVNYVAKTTFITLKKGQAYIAATEHIEKKETMKALKGLIVVNKISATKVEVFTISDQSYEHADGQGEATESRALTSLKNEQTRAFKNSKTADKATELLAE